MEIRCDHCDARLSVPDEKLKGGGLCKVSCPKCNGEIRVDFESRNGKGEIAVSETPLTPNEKDGLGGGFGFSSFKNLEGKKTALLLEPDLSEMSLIKGTVEKLGYEPVHVDNTRDAIGQMRFHHFDLIVISDRFDDVAWNESPVLNYINALNMSARRRMFVVLIGEGLKTRDPMRAFSLSVNLVIGREDKASLGGVLEQSIAEIEKFYRVFMEISAETGKF
ncbi:MAG: zinc-ribbon domain-containing protein [Deltaproteobacteria bacterium]|nr:zinc-ribbon domain-containing protein [Deltaproteobacteria bacterium]MBW1816261.1 zinc-ribbon domain-containing protein [Deltaproteobacteria bacterium]